METKIDDTRGAVKVVIQVSVDSLFPDDPDRTVSDTLQVTFADTMCVVRLPSLVSNNNKSASESF